ncbi:MAG TPA: tripartite tricarboxylate transporter substrate-binding protein [Ramlibacter sp.]|nr:tripartite tricarboxylate transporter substrate-binding protein [Ramlibacter sp.]
MRKNLDIIAMALSAICGLLPLTGVAQTFKAPIKIVVPYAAGGGTDVLARLLGQGLSRELGQPVIVENKAGASGQIGTQFVQAAAPNGATLLFTVDHSLITVPLTTPTAKYDAEADFIPLGQAARSVWTLSIPASASYKDFAGFAAAVKTDASQRSFGVPFTGGAPTLIGEALGRHWGVPMEAIPFSGSGPVIQNVIAGQVPAGITGMPEAMAVQRSGKARVIAVSGAQRSALLPDAPTFKELAITGLEFHTFLGFFAPKNLPREMAQEFNAALRKVLADPAVLEKLSGMSLQPAPTTLAEARDEVAAMERFWKTALGATR